MAIQDKPTLKSYFEDGDKPTQSNFADLIDSLCDDTVYGSGWNGVTDTAPSKNAVYDKLETLLSNGLSSAKIFVGNGSNLAAAVSLSGEATLDNTGAITLQNSAVIGKVLTGYSSGAGTVTATDTILQAIQKLNGNIANYVPLISGNVDFIFYSSDSFSLTNDLGGFTKSWLFYDANNTKLGFNANYLDITSGGFQVNGAGLYPSVANSYDLGKNASTGDWRKIYVRTLQPADVSGTDILGTNTIIAAGNGTGGGVQNTSESAAIILQAPQILATGLSSVQTSTRVAQFGWWNGGTTGAPSNIAAMWMGNVTPSGTNFTIFRSSDLFINAPGSGNTYFRAGGTDVFHIKPGGGIATGNTLVETYRTSNGGSNVTPHILFDASNSTTSGSLAYTFDTGNGLGFLHANSSSIRILGWSAKLTSLVNTAGSESSNLSLTPQNTTDSFIIGGKAQALSLAINGTAGAGFLNLVAQSSTPSTPGSGNSLFSDSSNRFSWIGTNGFVRTLDGTSITASRVYTLPDASVTLAGVDGNGNIPSLIQPYEFYGEGVTNKDYTIDAKANFGWTLAQIRGLKTSSGTCTIAIKINGTAVTWTGSVTTINVTSTAQDVSIISGGTFSRGDRVIITITSAASPADLEFTLI